MFLDFLALLTAISISGVAAYYSIVGLTAIFSGVFLPIVIMGSVLEFGKIITTVWLHLNWLKINFLIKWYMSIAVIVLMFITSMGIFGFLSRAHIDATSSVGDNQLIIDQLNLQIDVEKKRIDDSQRVISQMDTAINNILNQSSNSKTLDNQRGGQIANQANSLRNQQRKERQALTETVDQSNKRIADINSQKLKLQQAQAKTEAEVGPIKYIAQLIYGDQVNKDLLERAVRWVIIIIVAVFDPLAISMVLAITMAISKSRKNKNETVKQQDTTTGSTERSATTAAEDSSRDQEGFGKTTTESSSTEQLDDNTVVRFVEKPIVEYKTIEIEKIIEVEKPVEVIKAVTIERPVEIIKEVEKIVEVEKPIEIIKEVRVEDHDRMVELAKEIDNLLAELKNKEHLIGQLRAEISILENPEEFTINDAVFGKDLPDIGSSGQLFCQYSAVGLTIYKWNDEKWIMVDKNQNDSYLLDEPVTNSIITTLATGELAWESLTHREQEALEPLLKDNFNIARK